MGAHSALLHQLLRLPVRHRYLCRERPFATDPTRRRARRPALPQLPLVWFLGVQHRTAEKGGRGYDLARTCQADLSAVRELPQTDGGIAGIKNFLTSIHIPDIAENPPA